MLADLLGLVCVCAVAPRVVAAAFDTRERVLAWPRSISQAWVSSLAVNVRGECTNTWVLRDEVDVRTWSALRRHLRIHCPTQAVGLSISR